MEPGSGIENQELKSNCEEIDYISQLHISLVHRIYSLLPSRDVASTSVLSRAWNNYWYEYPYAEFQFVYNNCYHQQQEFLDLIDNSVLRRLGRVSSLEKFKMYIKFPDLSVLAPYLDRWISIAVRNGLLEFALKVEIRLGNNIRCYYNVPQVVMEVDTLKVLSLSGCTFGSGLEVKLPHLKRLSLNYCEFVNDLLFRLMTFGCPVIEYLKITYCRWMGKVLPLMNLPQLKHFEFLPYTTNRHALYFAPTLNQLSRSFDLKSCQALMELKLYNLEFLHNLLPQHLISQLPALEVLEFEHCTCSEDFIISSEMLKRLVFKHCRLFNLTEVDTPNLESVEFYNSGPFVLLNVSTNLKLHIIYGRHFQKAVALHRLLSFLSTWRSKVLKLVVHHNSKNVIIHERVSDIRLSSLRDFIFSNFICISSKSLTDLMEELIPERVYPKKVYIVYSDNKTVQVLSDKIKDMGRNPNLQHKLFDLKVNTCVEVEDDMDPVTSVFIEKHSIPPYKNSVFMLNWMPDVSAII